MTDKRYIFRGFHPDENGKKLITYNGESVRGEWLYWNNYGRLYDSKKWQPTEYETDGYFAKYASEIEILADTVGQWVTTDRKGRNVFEGDRCKAFLSFTNSYETGEVVYIKSDCEYALQHEFFIGRLNNFVKIELIGNTWEAQADAADVADT